MASKRSIDVSASGSGNQAKKPKREVSVATFQKWQKQEEKEHKTISWLRCDKQVTSQVFGVGHAENSKTIYVGSRTFRLHGSLGPLTRSYVM